MILTEALVALSRKLRLSKSREAYKLNPVITCNKNLILPFLSVSYAVSFLSNLIYILKMKI